MVTVEDKALASPILLMGSLIALRTASALHIDHAMEETIRSVEVTIALACTVTPEQSLGIGHGLQYEFSCAQRALNTWCSTEEWSDVFARHR